ncbi:hypothetical protein [Streptomyces sp. RG80]|uniref:hypothetical protein n=1 Tax=Streptomyces sp. RG80 TaxID=3157340 RepID=UPI00338EF613
MSTSFDIALKSNGNWKIGGSKELAHSISVNVGYYNQKYSRQYKVPIEYIRYKHQHICSGTVRSSWLTVEPNKYKIGADGAVGEPGRDV